MFAELNDVRGRCLANLANHSPNCIALDLRNASSAPVWTIKSSSEFLAERFPQVRDIALVQEPLAILMREGCNRPPFFAKLGGDRDADANWLAHRRRTLDGLDLNAVDRPVMEFDGDYGRDHRPDAHRAVAVADGLVAWLPAAAA